MSAPWSQDFTFEEVALALAQFAIARGSPLPYAFNMDEPSLSVAEPGAASPFYMRLRYARRDPAPTPQTLRGRG